MEEDRRRSGGATGPSRRSASDIGRISDDDWKGVLDRLAKAKGIVFDFRGYPQMLSVTRTRAGIVAGRDELLEKAIEVVAH